MVDTGYRKRLGAAARRESILAAAIPEFAASGYDRTRVSDIAARVGVTEPVVFQNFGTKAGLFVAALDRMSGEVVLHLAELADHSPDVVELLSVLLAQDEQDRVHSSVGLGMMFAEAAGNPEPSIRGAGKRAHERLSEAVAGLLRRGQTGGSIRDDIAAVSLAWLVISQIHARQFRRAHSETSPTLEHAILEGLLATLRSPERA